MIKYEVLKPERNFPCQCLPQEKVLLKKNYHFSEPHTGKQIKCIFWLKQDNLFLWETVVLSRALITGYLDQCYCSLKVMQYSAEIRTVSCVDSHCGTQEAGFWIQLVLDSAFCLVFAQSCLQERMSLCSHGICQLHGAFSGEMGELDDFWRCFVVWVYFEILSLCF